MGSYQSLFRFNFHFSRLSLLFHRGHTLLKQFHCFLRSRQIQWFIGRRWGRVEDTFSVSNSASESELGSASESWITIMSLLELLLVLGCTSSSFPDLRWFFDIEACFLDIVPELSGRLGPAVSAVLLAECELGNGMIPSARNMSKRLVT